MKPLLCPRCAKLALIEIADGFYRCSNCGYTGKASFNEEIYKK